MFFIVNSQVLMLTITPAISLVLSFVLELIIVWEGLYKVKVETQSQISYEIDFEIIHFKKSDSTLYDIWYIFKLLFTDLCWPYRSVYDKWLIVPSKVIARLHVIWPPPPPPPSPQSFCSQVLDKKYKYFKQFHQLFDSDI